MKAINPYIHFNGNTEEAFNFYKSIFGGEFDVLMRFKDMPQNPEYPLPESEADKIAHVALPIGLDSMLMGSDTPESMGRHNENETRSKIVISADDREEADRIFAALSEGGLVEMPISDASWGSYFGMLRDRYGIEWIMDFTEG